MRRELIERALERVGSALAAEESVRGALARRAVGVARQEDEGLLAGGMASIVEAQRPDGGWPGSDRLEATGRALLELAELQEALGKAAAPMEEAVSAALTWLRSRRGAPGRFGEGCSPSFHEARLCHHYVSSFHAPAWDTGEAPDPAPGPDELVCQAALALRGALRWGEGGDTVDVHVEGLRQVVAQWAWPGDEPLLSAGSGVAALGGVLEAPQTHANVVAAADGVACLVRTQRADGTWAGVQLFDALETLLLGVARGFRVDEVDAALARSAELLALTVRPNGTWGAERSAATERLPLLAWRVLRQALECAPGPATPA